MVMPHKKWPPGGQRVVSISARCASPRVAQTQLPSGLGQAAQDPAEHGSEHPLPGPFVPFGLFSFALVWGLCAPIITPDAACAL